MLAPPGNFRCQIATATHVQTDAVAIEVIRAGLADVQPLLGLASVNRSHAIGNVRDNCLAEVRRPLQDSGPIARHVGIRAAKASISRHARWADDQLARAASEAAINFGATMAADG